MMIRVALVTVLAAVAVVPEPSTARDRVLRTEMILPASVEQVWTLWTTEAGLTSFFARGARIEPRVDGVFEILFNPSAPPGSRGAEGLRILAFEPPKRLAFTWNAPPDQPYARAQRTVVTIDLADAGDSRTRLTFTHAGWGTGAEWDKLTTTSIAHGVGSCCRCLSTESSTGLWTGPTCRRLRRSRSR